MIARPLYTAGVEILLFLTILFLVFPCTAVAVFQAPPLLLSLDVEKDSDVESLQTLNLEEPATYFITGEFATKYPDIVRQLSTRGTIGSHSYAHLRMTELPPEEIRQDLLDSSIAIEKATGIKPIWFRAPFLLYNKEVLEAAYELGFKFDSSMPGRWVDQQVINEFPISINSTGRILFSDYDIFTAFGFSQEMTLDLLKENYLLRMQSGRPFIFLLHPSIISEYRDILFRFIDFVKLQGGACLSFDQYLNSVSPQEDQRLGLTYTVQHETIDSEAIITDFLNLGVTDVFLDMHYLFAEGGDQDEIQRASETVSHFIQSLKEQDFLVHGTISILHDPGAAQSSAHVPMTDRTGTPSSEWLSPSATSTQTRIVEMISELIYTYQVDGIHLLNLSFPGIHYDFSQEALKQFSQDTSIRYNETNLSTITTDHYNEWVSWRVSQLEEIIRNSADLIDRIDSDVRLSASLEAGALLNFREMEESGQDARILAEMLDFVVFTQQTPQKSRLLAPASDYTALSRAFLGNRPFLISLPGLDPQNWSSPSFDTHLNKLLYETSTANGVLLTRYNDHFTNDTEKKYRFENLHSILTDIQQMAAPLVAAPQQLPSTPALPDKPGANDVPASLKAQEGPKSSTLMSRFPQKRILLLVVGSSLILVTIVVVTYRYRQNTNDTSSELEKTAMLGVEEIEQAIMAGEISGPLVHTVARILRSYDPVMVSKYRIYMLLSLIKNTHQSLSVDDLLAIDIDIPGWQVLAMSHFKEALLHNYLKLSGDTISLTQKGEANLKSANEQGFDPLHWIFVEKRLHENLLVICPFCRSENTAHWYWPHFACTSCGQEIKFKSCKTPIVRHETGIGLDHHHFH